jgi:hypothetical protein
MPIRPIINWKNAPAYELAKHVATLLHNHLELPYTYNIKNSIHLITDLQTIEINEDTRICSFDIKNMYTNIPKSDTLNIIKNITNRNQNTINQNELLETLKIIMEQNYFQFNQQYYKQTEGLAMGAPTSAILAETYIQHMEHKHLYPILIKHKITGYFRYVDDILMIYNQNQTNIEETINEFNRLNNNIKFTIEKEHDNSINFLDITINRKNTKMEFEIYRKPTQTDIIIPNDSCHPYEHKISAINYLINRANTYPITKEAKKKEFQTIQNILGNNKYYNYIINKKHPTIQKQNENRDTQQQKKKWATFTYYGKETRKITRLFKDTHIKIAFKTKNTIQNILKPHNKENSQCEKNGVYQLNCMSCPAKYIGQTGRPFHTRYKEHIRDIRNNNSNSGYANHILNTGHTYGTMADIMEIIKIENLNTLEKYHIYKANKEGPIMNDMHNEAQNPIFEVLRDTNRWHRDTI